MNESKTDVFQLRFPHKSEINPLSLLFPIWKQPRGMKCTL